MIELFETAWLSTSFISFVSGVKHWCWWCGGREGMATRAALFLHPDRPIACALCAICYDDPDKLILLSDKDIFTLKVLRGL